MDFIVLLIKFVMGLFKIIFDFPITSDLTFGYLFVSIMIVYYLFKFVLFRFFNIGGGRNDD